MSITVYVTAQVRNQRSSVHSPRNWVGGSNLDAFK
jgi:hypothetical protein